jgi:hypothetical protein
MSDRTFRDDEVSTFSPGEVERHPLAKKQSPKRNAQREGIGTEAKEVLILG